MHFNIIFVIFFLILPFCSRKYTPGDAFVGYHNDTAASVVLQVTSNTKDSEQGEFSDEHSFEEQVWEN